MQSIMCVDDVESLDSSLFQIPVGQIPILSGQGLVEVPAQRSAQTSAVVELGKRLLLASKDGDVELVRELMSKGAPFTTDWLGVSPLHLAAQSNHVSTAEVLLRAGISQEARTKVERTPLHMAAEGGHLESVQLLLAHGADINCRDMLRMTPLHWAVQKQNLEVIEALLRSGADPLAVSKFDKTPLSMALEMGRHDIVHLLQTTDVSNILSLQTPSHELDQDTLAATESIAAELGTVGQHDAVTQQIQAGPTSPKKRPRIRVQVEAKQVNITTGLSTPSSNAQTPKRCTPTLSAGAVAAEAAAEAAAVAAETAATTGASQGAKPVTDTPVNSTMQLLQAHGITMLPNDESTIVESAMESGQTVVLTEAGKMALNLTRVGGHLIGTPKRGIGVGNPGIVGGVQKRTPIMSNKSRIIKIHPSQLVALGGGRVQLPSQLLMQHGKGPNILKRITVAPNSPIGTIKTIPLNSKLQRVMITKSQQPTFKLQQQTQQQQQRLEDQQAKVVEEVSLIDQVDEDDEDDSDQQPMPTDLATIAESLAAAQKEAAAFRKQLAKKEREAERYLQQLRTIKGTAK